MYLELSLFLDRAVEVFLLVQNLHSNVRVGITSLVHCSLETNKDPIGKLRFLIVI